MADIKKIEFQNLNMNIIAAWLNQYFLLTAGSADDYNMMTIAWGSIGGMWEKPFIQVVVRPGRYTYEFMEKYETFTVCAFPEKYKKDLMILGTKSGRNAKKISNTGLSVCPSREVSAPSYNEAELCFECRKIFSQDVKPENILKKEVLALYPAKDYHRVYFGEIIAIYGTDKYIK